MPSGGPCDPVAENHWGAGCADDGCGWLAGQGGNGGNGAPAG